MEKHVNCVWTPYCELQLYNALGGLNSRHFNRHFVVAVVMERFYDVVKLPIPPEVIKDKINKYLDSVQEWVTHFAKPDTYEEKEFSLPEDEFPEVGPAPGLNEFRERANNIPFEEREFSLPPEDFPQLAKNAPVKRKPGRPKKNPEPTTAISPGQPRET